jgi:hypothetical protein
MNTFLGELCRPAGIYLFLSIAVIISSLFYFTTKKIVPMGINLINSIITFFFVVVWTYILRFLCNSVSVTLVWLLVIINFLMVLFSFLIINAGLESGEIKAQDIFLIAPSE